MIDRGNPDGIVISGISGVFPNSENVEEFKENLLNGNDMISKCTRPNLEGWNIGLIRTIDRFDYSFFRINHHQAKNMIIASRLALEKTFEAILDAGYNPRELKGKNIAVICGIWESTIEGDPALEQKMDNYIDMLGRMGFMTANRISNWLDLHGPSYAVNTACSSSLYAIHHAIKTIQSGECEGAIVCAANFCFTWGEFYKESYVWSPEGNSAPFDIDANGYVRAEAVGVLFLQRKRDARRIYTNVIHSTTNSDGFKEEGFAFPSVTQQVQLYKQFYDEIGMDPRKISYIEAHGTGTKVGDIVEGTSIDDFFCANRTTPLKIGSLKSNMGHAEAAAAFCAMIKMIIAFETGIIPPNLRYKTPNPKIKGLINGRMEIVSKPTPLEGEYFALNSFGIGGSNGHIVLSPHNKVKCENVLPNENFPRLVVVSGRTEEAVGFILNNAEQNHNDPEYIRLLHEIFKYEINGHLHRGYTILQKNEKAKQSIKYFSGEKRPIWFVFSGMGSQWPAMGKLLMDIPIFAESIQKSHRVLLSKGLDLVKIITDEDPQIFNNILNSFVGIAAIQVALVDTLKKINITADGLVGHSLGESGCAYADGCFTDEQAILSAYYRGLVSLETDLMQGTMAAVGESYNCVKDFVPPEIDISCHNGPTSCTISGPTQIMQKFITNLEEKKIFVRIVNSSNIAYHSRYIAPVRPKLISYLRTVIPEPKLRSKKWICTSAPEHEWDCEEVKYASAEYFTNNMLSTVYFEESYRHIPDNAITVEIAPHGLLNAILKRSLPTTVDNIPLTMKNHENNIEYLLNAFGRLYEMGCDMELSHLYPPVEFPVSKSTQMISPLIKWRHDEQWHTDQIYSDAGSQSNERKFYFNAASEDSEHYSGHVINGKNLYPGFGYLWLVIETLAMMNKTKVTEGSIALENVHFENPVVISNKGGVHFTVSIHETTKYFQVKANRVVVVYGKIRVLDDAHKELIDVTPHFGNTSYTDTLPMGKDDFYKELRLRGYHYKGLFKNVEIVNCDGQYAEISWRNNFVCFMDAMAQIILLHLDYRDALLPTFLDKIVIDFKKHFEILKSLDKENTKFPVCYDPHNGILCSGGIQMGKWKLVEMARQKNRNEPIHEKYQFYPYISEEKLDLIPAVRLCVQISLYNTSLITKAVTYEVLDQEYNSELVTISSAILLALNDAPLIKPNVNILINSEKMEETDEQSEITISNNPLPRDKSALLIIISNIQNKTDLFESIFDTLRDEGFIITTISIDDNTSFENLGFNVCFSRIITDSEKLILLKKKTEPKSVKQTVQIKNDTYSWISELQNALSNVEPENDEKLVVFAEKEPISGILGFYNCLRKEEKHFRCFFIIDDNAPTFSLDDPFYKSQFDKNLWYNVYKDGKWGSYLHLILEPSTDVEATHAFCMLTERGNLSSFKWVQGSLDPSTYKANGKSLIHVYYSGLNFKDVMLSIGRISITDSYSYSRLIECYQGDEYSGKNENGERLMGIVCGKGIATMVEPIPHLTWKIPDYMTLEEAASIPIVYSTIVYAFFFKMQLKEGCSILIHSGSGGIGQAAINICIHYKCNIFTTVGTPEKVEFIRKTFPQIPASHIGNSRDTSFSQMIMTQTEGKGVDVVLNSLTEDKLRASLHCVAKGGHFLEIGKFDMTRNNSLELGHFINDIEFHSVQLDIAILQGPNEKMIGISNKLQEMLNEGVIKPITRTVFQTDEVESAFRFMASGKHIGKLVIQIRNEEKNLKSKPTLLRFKVKPRVICHKNKSYVVLGGLGGFGMELVDWLVTRGAGNIILSSRNGLENGYQSYRIKLWRSYGVNVLISTADISQEIGVQEILEIANSLGPVTGIFNLAMVLKDGLFLNQTEENFNTVANPKSTATVHLDKLSRQMCPYLEYFVVFSSIACGNGNADQTNYGFANSIMERICEARCADNLPGLAIQWGAIGDVGYFSELFENDSAITLGGVAQQQMKSCLETLDRFMTQPNPIALSKIIAEKRKTDFDIISTVANLLGIKDVKTISLTWTLPELGMDSILGVELKQILEAEFNIFLTPEDLRTMTFAKLYLLKEGKETNTVQKSPSNSNLLEFFFNDEFWNQPILRIPFNEGKIREQLPIDENPTIFVFPGVEGLAITMESLAENLPWQTLCFQYHFVETENFMQNLCEYFLSYILEKLRPEQKFYFIGYSYGSAVTLEVAARLEKQGRKGHIWLIDSSPATIEMVGKAKYEEKAVNDEMIQNRICVGVIQTLMPGLSKDKYDKHIEKTSGWESKKKLCFSMIPQGGKSENHWHRLFDRLYKVLNAMAKYEKPCFQLQSSCTLIRSVENLFDLPLDESYGLTEYFKNPVDVHKINDVDHYSILLHSQTSEIIMKSLPVSSKND